MEIPESVLDSTLIFDIETNGLKGEADTIWVIAAKEMITDHWYVWSPDDGEESLTIMLELLDNANRLCAHNGIDFDRPMIYALTGKWLNPKMIDTYTMSRVLYPDRPGGHSVANLAKYFHLSEGKVEQEQWEEFEDNMIERCRSDVRLQEQIYLKLLEESRV